jgi:hypothetical protein
MPEIDILDNEYKLDSNGKNVEFDVGGAEFQIVDGNLNVDGNIDAENILADQVTAGLVWPAAVNYSGADAAGKAILPSVFNAHLTKGSAGNDYTLAAPGAANIGHMLHVTSDGAFAHVVTVTGLLGGTTMTFAAAVGNGFTLLAVSATLWRVIASTGITQT